MRLGIAGDHGGFELKQVLARVLSEAGHSVTDFGPSSLDAGDDYPDFVIPLARAVGAGDLERGIAVCGSGVGACIAANKVPGARAALVHEVFSAHQGVEDDNMNVMCLGGRVVGFALAWDLVKTYLSARYIGAERHRRRLAKIEAIEGKGRP